MSLDDATIKYITKQSCLVSQLFFTRYFFKNVNGAKFILNNHHRLICDTLDKVITGEITRLIINIPPGYTKTELAVIHFIARGLAVNPKAKFIQTSASKSLVGKNSTMVRDIIMSKEYQEFWPLKVRSDSKGKQEWYLKQGGGLYSMPMGGMITGYRAGLMESGFTGALICDDPMKPKDAYSSVKRESINEIFPNTLASRLAQESVPMILIMQRVHDEDTTSFLLQGGTGEKWHHLNIPVKKDDRYSYPAKYTHGIDIPVGDIWDKDGVLWKFKHTKNDIKLMEQAKKYTFASQYMQNPAPLGGGMFKEDYWQYYTVKPEFEKIIITGDTAQKTKEHNDFSVFQCWGIAKHNQSIYLIDQIRGKWEAPMLKKMFLMFWNKHKHNDGQQWAGVKVAYIEDKASGTGLIQDIKKDVNIKAVQRNVDKVTRSTDNVDYIAAGRVYLPENEPFLVDYISEFSSFSPLGTHKHDDQIDPTLDAIDILLRKSAVSVGTW